MKWTCSQNHTLLNELALKMPEASKTTLKNFIKGGRLFVDGKPVKKNIDLTSGACCEIQGKAKTIEDIDIVYEDREIIVIDKPEGLLSVATDKESEQTLLYKLKKKYGKVWPVHRLDRDTSGLLVFALTEKARDGLIQQFISHSIDREYRAIVIGDLPEKGIWKHHLVEDGNLKMHVTPGEGVYAETHYQRLEKHGEFCFVRFRLKTGKKNQIRVQASHMGYPILGDKKYGSQEITSERMCLHAHKLGFLHPISKKKLSFISPIPFSIR